MGRVATALLAASLVETARTPIAVRDDDAHAAFAETAAGLVRQAQELRAKSLGWGTAAGRQGRSRTSCGRGSQAHEEE
jgi:hypothetical protein